MAWKVEFHSDNTDYKTILQECVNKELTLEDCIGILTRVRSVYGIKHMHKLRIRNVATDEVIPGDLFI